MDTTNDIERQLLWFKDMHEIQVLKARYSELCDRAIRLKDVTAAVALADLFTEDAIVDMGAPRSPFIGRIAITKFYGEDLPATVTWAWHAPLAPIITIEGDWAQANWIVHAAATFPSTPDAPPLLTFGRYVDNYVRTISGWKQSHLKFLNETPQSATADPKK